MEPYWGGLRQFVIDSTNTCKVPYFPEYSEDPSSEYYQQNYAVYQASLTLTDAQKDQALYYEDAPGLTPIAAGQIYYLAGVLSEQEGLNLPQAAEAAAIMMIGQADGFINTWAHKYEDMIQRPISYIQQVIDPTWQPFLSTPPFPEYPSGHSTSAGSFRVMGSHFFGANTSFTNDIYAYLGYPDRHFDSMDAFTQDDGWSRLYAGVHYPMAIENAIASGDCLSQIILQEVDTRK